MELPPLSWNGVDEESKGEMKKGKEIRETINRYIELAGIVILKGDTGVFDREKQILENKKKKKEKKKRNIHIRRINGASGNGLSNSISSRSVPSEKENLRGQKEMRRKRIWITG